MHKKNYNEDILRKKIQTTMIGALARFEEGFGYLWGHNQDSLTPKQLEFKNMWDKVRTEILNNGNDQIRAGISEMRSPQNLDKVKYSYYYKFNPRRYNNEE